MVCSGYAYVMSILGNLIVWHGRGSSSVEHAAALSYAKSISVRHLLCAHPLTRLDRSVGAGGEGGNLELAHILALPQRQGALGLGQSLALSLAFPARARRRRSG